MEQETKHFTQKRRIRWLVAVICTLALVLASLPLVSLTASASTPIYVRTEAKVNLRSGAGNNYSSIKVIAKDTTLTLLDRSNTNWYKVRLADGTTGYCYVPYMDVLNDCKTTDYLNFRTGPSTNYTIMRTLPPNTQMDIICFCGNSWLKGQTSDGTVGYVCTDYVDYIADASIKVSTSTSQTTSGGFALSESSRQLAKGRKFTLTASGAKGTVAWTSSDSKVAEVTDEGVVKGLRTGTAVITAVDTKSKQSMTCKVTVVQTDYRFIFLSETSKKIEAGQSFTLTGRTEPEGGKYTLKSSDTSVVTVTQAGVVKGISAGTASITASDATGVITRTCQVTVTAKPAAKPVTPAPSTTSGGSISLSQTTAAVYAGSSFRLYATTSPSSLAVTWTSSNNSVASVNDGRVSGLRAGTAVITASDSTGQVKAKCTVTVYGVNSGYVTLSRYSASTTAGKTIYIQGYNGSTWGSSDPGVATVWNGFIETKKAGRAAITYTNSSGQKAICVVTVSEPAPIKFAYSSPNSATLSSKVTLVAITDKKRTGVYFEVKDGVSSSIMATSKTVEGDTIVWKGSYTPTKAGTFTVKAYSKYNNTWSTCADGTSDVFISNKNSSQESGLKRLRASDGVISLIGTMEGYVSGITYDWMAYNVPTLGHGYVVWEGECFYNNLTRGEAFALLVRSINVLNFTSDVNNLLINNGISFNQQQFDALVSFSYNLGTGWTYSSDVKNTLLNCHGSTGRDLRYVNRNALISQVLAYHHAGGNCYYGLLYRRADELEMFLYNDYQVDGRNNKYHFPNPSCISFP